MLRNHMQPAIRFKPKFLNAIGDKAGREVEIYIANASVSILPMTL